MKKLITFGVHYLVALTGSIYLFCVGFLLGRNRSLINSMAHHFVSRLDPDPNNPKSEIPSLDPAKVIGEEPSIQICEAGFANGNVTPLELIIIDQLIAKHSPERLFEIGTFDGRTTLNMAVNSRAGAHVYTLDLPGEQASSTALRIESYEKMYVEKPVSGARFIGKPCASKITQLYGDSATFDFKPYENSIDFVFVDASHSYEYVINDTRVALRLLRSGKGIIVWHDFTAWPGVTLALNEFQKAGKELRNVVQIAGTTLAYIHLT
jgi:predicted O-methyltransferase YrrM